MVSKQDREQEIRGRAANLLLILNGCNTSTIVSRCSRIAFLLFLCQNKTRIGQYHWDVNDDNVLTVTITWTPDTE